MPPTENHDGDQSTEQYINRPALYARITTRDDGISECTIFPEEVSQAEQTTRWITAEEEAYVEVSEVC